MEVRWSIEAYADLERIYQLISRDNPTAAQEVIQRIYDGCADLSQFPYVAAQAGCRAGGN